MKQEEARTLLESLDQTEGEARLKLALLGGWTLVLWGTVWALGNFLLTWNPEVGGRFWTVASPLGVLLSFYLGVRQSVRVRTILGLQTFYFWVLLILFALLHWLPLLPPTDLRGESFLVSLVAFAFAYLGTLWRIPGMAWAGLGLFAVNLALYWAFPDLFHLGMGAVGLLALVYGGVLLWRWTR